MKKLSLIALCILLSNLSFAQTIELVKSDRFRMPSYDDSIDIGVCYDDDYLVKLSDEMFAQGNPNYIWVDLLKDGYVDYTDTTALTVYVHDNNSKPGGNVDIPADVRKAYAEKWFSFVDAIKEPRVANTIYIIRKHEGIGAPAIGHRESAFRKKIKEAQYHAHLTKRGELRLLKEMVADGIARPDSKVQYDFSRKGFFVSGKRINRDLREKYMQICTEEFGHDYFNDRSSTSAKSDMTFSEKVNNLEAMMPAIAQASTE